MRVGCSRFKPGDAARATSAAVLALALSCVAAAAGAEELAVGPRWVARSWTLEEGLPQNSVNAIVQADDGYLYLGTFGGLARFDGVHFDVLGPREGLPASRITALQSASDGTLWIGTEDAGVFRSTAGHGFEQVPLPELPVGPVVGIRSDRDGVTWIGTSRGLIRLDAAGARAWDEERGMPDDWVMSLLEDSRGTLWVGTETGLLRREGERFVRVPLPAPDPSVRSIAEDDDGTLWVATLSSLLRSTSTGFEAVPRPAGYDGEVAAQLLVGADGAIWLGANALFRRHDGAWESLALPLRAQGTVAKAIFQDREGSVWVGLDGGGLVRLRSSRIRSYTLPPLDVSTVPIVEGADGAMWIGTLCNGLVRLAGDVATAVRRDDGGSFGCVWSLHVDRSGALWVGHGGGLTRIDGSGQRHFTVPGEVQVAGEDNYGLGVRAILEDSRGRLWVGTATGLSRFEDAGLANVRVTKVLAGIHVRSIVEARDGSLLIGTQAGLSRYRDGESAGKIDRASGLSSDDVRVVLEDADGTLWIGTYGGGLNRVRDGKISHYFRTDGLNDDVVSQIFDDGQGFLWMSGNRGISRVARRDLEAFAEGRITSLNAVAFGQADGMVETECNGGAQPAGWQARDGKLWFPTIRGVVMVDPRPLPINRVPPGVAIVRVTAGQTEVPLADRVEIAPGTSRLEIHYAGLSFVAPERLRFRYQLEGLDDAWVEAGGRRTAYYTQPPAGDYLFRVTAANEDGIWNPTGASVQIRLRPRFYETRTFLGVALVAAALLLFGFYELRVHRLRQRQRELERLVGQRTAQLESHRDQLRELNEGLEQRVDSQTKTIRETRDVAIFTLAKLAELRDDATGKHMQRIGEYCRLLAGELVRRGVVDLEDEFVEQIHRSSQLHDIGKVAVPDAILLKEGPLSAEDLEVMQSHVTVGGDALRSVLERYDSPSFLSMAMDIAYFHHEKWDGSGYPRGLAGDEIPLAARIVAVADAYDALTSNRPYQTSVGHPVAVERIRRDRGTHFDPAVVDTFLSVEADIRRIRADLVG